MADKKASTARKMKILGKKSLSSIITIFLEALFVICVAVIISGGIIIIKKFEELISLDIAKTLLVVYLSGIPALVIIFQFLKIFKGLKNEKVFDKENIKRFQISYMASIIIGIMYMINSIFLFCSDLSTASLTLYLIFTYTIAIVFLIFGIGLVVLNEIYKKAIQFKEENDLTI